METTSHFNEKGRTRTDSSEKSKIREIHDLLKRKISLKEKAREFFSTETSLKGIGELQNIYRELLSLLENKKYATFQRKIGMKESEIDGKLGESTLRRLKLYIIAEEKTYPLKSTILRYISEDLSKDSYIEWTEKSSQSRLLTIRNFLNDGGKNKSFPLLRKNLLITLDRQGYIDFQRKIGMPQSERDGKLGKKTLEFMYAYFSSLEESKKRTEENSSSKLNEIKDCLNHIPDERQTTEFHDLKKLLSKGYYRNFQKLIGIPQSERDGKLGKKTLEQLKKYIEKFIQKLGKITLEKNKDSTGKYKIYSYIVRKGGQPQHIRREYIRQIGGGESGIKITDSKGNEYPENKNFIANDKVFIKVPLFETIDSMSKDTKEKIKIQEDYLKKQNRNHQETLAEFNRQQPMGKDVEFSFGIPVKEYEDIDKTLASITTNQNIDPKKFEVVILLNRPNEEVPFDQETKEKILRFKKRHPEYNICVFEKTFNFGRDKDGKLKIHYGKIYKTLGDTIVYRNIKRKNIRGMDMKKIRSLIIKTGAADSTDKNPKYIENQLEKYSRTIGDKEIVRIKGESRLPAKLCKTYPLVELLEFFQRHFDDEYAGGTLNRNVGIGTYKSWIYCDANGFDGVKCFKGEDKDLVSRIRNRVKDKKNSTKVSMFHDGGFIGAVDESCDRGIWAMVERGFPYCDRYNDKQGDIATKEKNWNTYAIEHKGEEKFKTLEMTIENLEKNLSAFYKQRIRDIFNRKTHSNLYHGNKEEHIQGYLDSEEGKNASDEERVQWIAQNVIDPIMERVLNKSDFMGLNQDDYTFHCNPIVRTEKIMKNGKEEIKKTIGGTIKVKFRDEAIEKIMKVHERKINTGYYHYW